MKSAIRTDRIAWANEVVPLSQRLLYLDVFRGLAAVLVGASAHLLQTAGTTGPGVLASTAIYAALTLVGGALWRTLKRRSLTLFGALIIIDGLYLAWITYATGGSSSPLRYLILLHLITVTLLASYRTGLKLALWHTLLLLVTFHLSREGILLASGRGSDPEVLATVTFVLVFWLAAFLTSSLAAINERELRRRKVDVEALATMATELESTKDPDSLAAIIASNVMRHFAPRRVALLKADHRRIMPWAFEGDRQGSVRSFAPSEASVLLEVLRQRGTALVRRLDPSVDVGLADLLPDAENLVVLPLSAESGMIGLLVVEYGDRTASRIARRSVEILERVSSHGALALRNALLAEEMETLASTDALTSVANRRTFDVVIERRIRIAARQEKNVSLIFADIDHFKRLNDAKGHKFGDQVLREVSASLGRHVRSVDTVARYGGEEFAIVLPNCGEVEAAARAEELRRGIEAELEAHGLTLSFGVATYPVHGSSTDTLVGAADNALYRSKRAGRNRVTVFAPDVKSVAAGRTAGRQRPRTSVAPRRPTIQREGRRDVA